MAKPYNRPLTAHRLFKSGHDSLSISSILGITEAEALEQVSSQRSAKLGLPDPYMSNRVPGGLSIRQFNQVQSVQSSGGG